MAAHDQIANSVPLTVAGTGPIEQTIRSTYPKPRYLGHVSGEALSETIRGAAVLVVPSEWYENCPMSILEAMAFGKPVVASDIGGIPELVVHEETGLLFRPGDADDLKRCLIALMENPSLRRRYGAAARERAQTQFSLEQHNVSLLRLYQGLASRTELNAQSAPSTDLLTTQD